MNCANTFCSLGLITGSPLSNWSPLYSNIGADLRFVTPRCREMASAMSLLKAAVSVSSIADVGPPLAPYSLPWMTMMHSASSDLLKNPAHPVWMLSIYRGAILIIESYVFWVIDAVLQSSFAWVSPAHYGASDLSSSRQQRHRDIERVLWDAYTRSDRSALQWQTMRLAYTQRAIGRGAWHCNIMNTRV